MEPVPSPAQVLPKWGSTKGMLKLPATKTEVTLEAASAATLKAHMLDPIDDSTTKGAETLGRLTPRSPLKRSTAGDPQSIGGGCAPPEHSAGRPR